MSVLGAVRAMACDVMVVAPGTSCRHQIHEGVMREAVHPIDIIWRAMGH
jgi:hypothetical protein